MDISDLNAFLTLSSVLNFTKAAEYMELSQSSFSRKINRLEEELGVELFVRNKRNVELTDAGKVFIQEATTLKNMSQRFVFSANQLQGNKNKQISIGFTDDEDNLVLAEVVKQFQERYPEVTIHLKDYEPMKLGEAILKDEIQFAYGTESCFGKNEVFEQEEIIEYPMCIALHEAHLTEKKVGEMISLKDFKNESFIMREQIMPAEGFKDISIFCTNEGFSPDVSCYAASFLNIPIYLECDLGVALLPLHMKRMCSKAIKFLPIKEPDIKLKIVLTWYKKRNLNQYEQLFKKLLCEEGKKEIYIQMYQ